MPTRFYTVYSYAVRSWMIQWNLRLNAKHVTKGRITPEMADNRQLMAESMSAMTPLLIVIIAAYLFLFLGFVTRSIAYNASYGLVLGLIHLPLAAWQIKLSVRFAKIERRLRRQAILEGRLRARFPDRLWAWRQSGAI